MNSAIAAARLANQRITKPLRGGPADVVEWLGAVQAQEYPFAKWALGLRMRSAATDTDIERAFDAGVILRTHVLRPTWHFVTPADIRWMLELTSPHIQRTMASYNRRLELDAATLNLALDVFARALEGGRHLTRAELAAHLERAGIVVKGQRLAHVVAHGELERVLCSGPRRGKHFTYALLAERAPTARSLPHDEALAELTLRFFRSHGPATIRDCNWWSGLSMANIKRGLEMNRASSVEIDGKTYWTIGRALSLVGVRPQPHLTLLPIYDEYLVAYRDREAVPHGPMTITTESRAKVMFLHALVIDGAIAGTWKPVKDQIEVTPLRRLTAAEREGIAAAAARYGAFADVPYRVEITRVSSPA